MAEKIRERDSFPLATDPDTEVLWISRLPLIGLMFGGALIGAFLLSAAYLRATGVFGRMIFDPTTDALLLGIVGVGVVALPLLRVHELKAGYSAVLSPDAVRVLHLFSDRSARWSDVVGVEIHEGRQAIFLLRWHPSRLERFLTTRYAVVIPLQFTGRSIRETLLLMVQLYPRVKQKIAPGDQARYL